MINNPVLIVSKLQEMERMHSLIKRRATGDRASFAERLGVSESTITRNIRMMRTLGAVIHYDDFSRTYYYPYPMDWSINFKIDRD